jgi:hypothetical protein
MGDPIQNRAEQDLLTQTKAELLAFEVAHDIALPKFDELATWILSLCMKQMAAKEGLAYLLLPNAPPQFWKGDVPTEAEVSALMRDPRCWKYRHPEFIAKEVEAIRLFCRAPALRPLDPPTGEGR